MYLLPLRADLKLWKHAIFGPKMVYLPQRRIFFGKTIKLIFMYLFHLSVYKTFKKSLEQIQSYGFQAQNGTFAGTYSSEEQAKTI